MYKFISAALLVTAAFAQSAPPKAAGAKAPAAQTVPPAAKTVPMDKTQLEAYLRHLDLIIPQVSLKIDDPKPGPTPDLYQVDVHLIFGQASQDRTYFVSKNGDKLFRGTVHDLHKSPFQDDLDKLKVDLQPSFGAPGASVVMVAFSDFQCPLCKEEAKVLRENVAKEYGDKVRVYFRDYPLDAIHNWARTAAIGGRCVFRSNPAMFWDYHDWIFAHQGEINVDNVKQKIGDFANEKKLDALQLGRCVDTKATENEVNQSVAQGKSLQVDATPTIFLNGRRLTGNLPWQNMKQLIDL
ncbi:MAG: thioredoxin domain-containing protein, partial [Bryobacteraceae bacterium]